MQRKIMLSYLFMILISTIITGVFSYHVAQQYYLLEVENKLFTLGKIIKHEVSSDNNFLDTEKLNKISVKYGDITDTRITFIDVEGNVLADSIVDYKKLENHADRPEIIKAFVEGDGESTRYSESVKQYLKYIAVRVDNNDHKMVMRLSIPVQSVVDIRTKLMLFIFAGIIIAIILAGVIGTQFTNNITKPIRQLIDATKNIAKGNFNELVKIEAGNEIGELTNSFVAMQNELDKTISQLWHRNVEMEAILDSTIGGLVAVDNNNKVILINDTAIKMFDIKKENIIGENVMLVVRNHLFNQFLREYSNHIREEIQKVFDIQYEDKYYKIYISPIKGRSSGNNKIGALTLIQDVTDIKRLENIRTEFVSNVTHELKTPLTSIRGFIETLKAGAISDEAVAERFLDIIDIEAERLSNLIGDILQLSEIETMKKDIRMEQFRLDDVINEVFDVVYQSAEKKRIDISYSIEENPDILIYANRDRIKQMFINLIDNGIKYNNAGGKVELTCRKRHKDIEFIILDNGIGISKEHIPRLFERFYRVDKGRSRDQGGTGLGLSIVKHIVQLYDGQIKVSSELGKGTEFIIKLPILEG